MIVKMEHNTEPQNNPWGTLTTVMTFDRGNNTRTTLPLNDNNDTRSKREIIGAVTPSTSVLIESLIQQLCSMFEGDPVQRNKLYFAICDRLHELKLIDSSYNMMEFETLRDQYHRALFHLVAVARASTGSESALHVPSCFTVEWSRYRREFQEISFIAAGGFGNVFKAQNRLDGIEYAIKKIVVHTGQVKSIMQHLEEVKTLAKLNHTNIVSYKGAWIESTLPSTFLPCLQFADHSQNTQSILSETGKSKSYSHQNVDTQNHSNTNSNERSHNSIESDKQDISLSHDNEIKHKIGQGINDKKSHEEYIWETNSDSISFRNDSKSDKQSDNYAQHNTINTDGTDSCEESSSNKRISPYISQMRQQYATLYIQMALCEKTLRQWLDERLDMSPQVISVILTQILCGLDYIHSHGIVHHDIKPSNIFISTSGCLQIQLGDFGLACPLQRDTHHSVLGTHMYAAPEQLEGKCNPKSDVYSVGIVLLELLVRTETRMELIKIITGLKRGQIPTTLAANYPKWVHIVSQLVQKDPNKRPSTSQLLQDLNEDKDVIIAQLKNDNIEKDKVIHTLQQRILMLEKQLGDKKH